MNKRDTVADVVREMRESCNRVGCHFNEAVGDWANRIERAHKREVRDAAKDLCTVVDDLIHLLKNPPHSEAEYATSEATIKRVANVVASARRMARDDQQPISTITKKEKQKNEHK